MMKDRERIFGVANTPASFLEGDWREIPRSEMLERVIVAVDGAKSEAEEVGDENYVQHVDKMLFPFLNAELEKARGSETENGERGDPQPIGSYDPLGALTLANSALSEAHDALEGVDPELLGGKEYWKTRQRIAKAGMVVASGHRTVASQEEGVEPENGGADSA